MVGMRREGIPNGMWMNSGNADLRETGLLREETQTRSMRRQLIRNVDLTKKWAKVR